MGLPLLYHIARAFVNDAYEKDTKSTHFLYYARCVSRETHFPVYFCVFHVKHTLQFIICLFHVKHYLITRPLFHVKQHFEWQPPCFT